MTLKEWLMEKWGIDFYEFAHFSDVRKAILICQWREDEGIDYSKNTEEKKYDRNRW